MKIAKIECFTPRVGHRNQLLVKVTTESGIYGWGESGLTGREHAVVGAIRHYSEFILGRDARRAGALWQEMYRSQYFEGGRVLSAAIGALDIAFHDIRAKAQGVPVFDLLGGSSATSSSFCNGARRSWSGNGRAGKNSHECRLDLYPVCAMGTAFHRHFRAARVNCAHSAVDGQGERGTGTGGRVGDRLSPSAESSRRPHRFVRKCQAGRWTSSKSLFAMKRRRRTKHCAG